MPPASLIVRCLLPVLWLSICGGARASLPLNVWHDAVRQYPYHSSAGAFANLQAIRQGVLFQEGPCKRTDQHLLFDGQGRLLRVVPNHLDRLETQAGLNRARFELAQKAQVRHWVPGQPNQTGYPFALACEQPDVDMRAAMRRYLGVQAADRFSGRWDGIQVGSAKRPVSLHEALRQVYQARKRQGRLTFPAAALGYLSGQVVIESGGRRDVRSGAQAKGILQLLPSVLKACKVPTRDHLHRVAQIDCALRLTEQNHRVLWPPFKARFGHLPKEKREALYSFLLVQAYHGGLGRVRNLLQAPELSKPAEYFARHHAHFSAGDMAFGMVFHNLGRQQLGMASLYYVTDVALASRHLCAQKALRNDPACRAGPLQASR
mgnify:CR=1 FL=1